MLQLGTMFAVGDRVRYTGKARTGNPAQAGTLGTVKAVSNPDYPYYKVEWDSGALLWDGGYLEDNLEKVGLTQWREFWDVVSTAFDAVTNAQAIEDEDLDDSEDEDEDDFDEDDFDPFCGLDSDTRAGIDALIEVRETHREAAEAAEVKRSRSEEIADAFDYLLTELAEIAQRPGGKEALSV